MTTPETTMLDRKSRAPILALGLFAAASSFFGGAVLIARPDGRLLGLPLYLLAHSPFHDFLVPGLILFFAVGLPNAVGAWLHLTRRRYATLTSLLSGALLLGWIVVEMILLRSFDGLQITYAVIGILTMCESYRIGSGRNPLFPNETARPANAPTRRVTHDEENARSDGRAVRQAPRDP